MNIFLDDKREIKQSHNNKKGIENFDAVVIRDYFTFEEFIDDNFDDIDIISFDHDLACFHLGKEYTGKDAANYLLNFIMDYDKNLPNWYVHSDNNKGRENIIKLFLNFMDKNLNIDISSYRYYHKGYINGKFI